MHSRHSGQADSHGQLHPAPDSNTMQAPEINPGEAITGLLVLGIMLAILTGESRGGKAVAKQPG
jgi:hypothetical protein